MVDTMRLSNNLIFGLPVVMDTDDDSIKEGTKVLLTYKGTDMAVMTVSSKWSPDKPKECLSAYGTATIEHPGVRMVAMERGRIYVGGDVVGIDTPTRDFPCETPAEVRAKLPAGVDVVAFQCRNPVHRAHYELFTRALDAPNVGDDAVVLVHPTCGPTQEDDIPGEVRPPLPTCLSHRASGGSTQPLSLCTRTLHHPRPHPRRCATRRTRC